MVVLSVTAAVALPSCVNSQPSQKPLGTEVQASATTNVLTSVDCESIAGEAPERAGEALEEAGYSVSWRSVQTASDGTAIADVETSAPPGRVVDIILEGDQAVILVAESGDPAASSPGPPTC